jgi:esterase
MPEQLLAVSVSGHGTPIILLHGLFGSSDNLGRVAAELEKEYQVWRVDLRNHGNSFHADEMNYPRMVEDLYRTMCVNNLSHAHLIGHSMGGKVAMQFALTYPERVLSLIVADISPVKYPAHHQAILKGLATLDLTQMANRKMADTALAEYIAEPGVRQFLLKSLDFSGNCSPKWKFNLKAIMEHYQDILDGCYSDKPFSGKTLFIAGGLSDYIKPDYRERTLALFPNTELKIIPDTSHWLHAEKPRIFIGICQRFLKETSKGI